MAVNIAFRIQCHRERLEPKGRAPGPEPVAPGD